MNRKNKILSIITLFLILSSCHQSNNEIKTITLSAKEDSKKRFKSNEEFLKYHSDSCHCAAQYELADSSQLTLIKNQFYKSKTGHLYEKTWSLRQLPKQDTLSNVLYFNGVISQEIDPLTFEPLDGWYSKDKQHVYYYRPVSGGMQITKLEGADVHTFKILSGHYKYAEDKDHFYDETAIIDGFLPDQTVKKYDSKKRVIILVSNHRKFHLEPAN